jgi:RNA polymerase sigma factor (sigma-70 family)
MLSAEGIVQSKEPKSRLDKEDQEWVMANMQLVYKEARRCAYILAAMTNIHEQGQLYLNWLDDFIQAGVLGMCEALVRYDPSHGASKGTYSFHWIKNCIHKAAGKATTRIGATKEHEWIKRIHVLPMSVVENQIKASSRFRDANQLDFVDRPEYEEVPEDLAPETKALMSFCLDKRYYSIIVRRFVGGETLEDIGNDLGISKERVRQIEAKSLAKMREFKPLVDHLYRVVERERKADDRLFRNIGRIVC